MKKVPLTRGLVAIVDDEDFDKVASRLWHVLEGPHTFYAQSSACGEDGPTLMHRFLLGVDASSLVDHRDGDGLNNTRGNLRIANSLQNARNQRRRAPRIINGLVAFKGVEAIPNATPKSRQWKASIRVNKRRIYLGSFFTECEAAAAYNKAALLYFGEFANLNDLTASRIPTQLGPPLEKPAPQKCQQACRKSPSAKSSKHKGVHPLPSPTKPWRAKLKVGGVSLHLGCFSTETEAALAYNEAAKKHFGEFARLNEVSL